MTQVPDDPQRHVDTVIRSADADAAAPAYDVGYGRPPKTTRFQPGKSGNPRGGKKRQPSVAGQVDQVLKRMVTVTEGGKSRRITLQEVMLRTIGNNAAKGDLKSAAFLLDLRHSHRDSKSPDIDPGILTNDSQLILEDLMRQLQTGNLLTDSSGIDAEMLQGQVQPAGSDGSLRDQPPRADEPQHTQPAERPISSASDALAMISNGPGRDEGVAPEAPADTSTSTEIPKAPTTAGSVAVAPPGTPQAGTTMPKPLATAYPEPFRREPAPVPVRAPGMITLVNPPPPPPIRIIQSAPTPYSRRERNDDDR